MLVEDEFHPEEKPALLKTLGPKQTLGHSAVFRIVEVGSFAVSGYVRLF